MKPGKTYHIYNHGNADDNLFRTEENYRYFLQKYGQYVQPVAFTFAYCLLPNHFHILLQVKDESSLSGLPGFMNLAGPRLEKKIILQFSHFFNGYTKAFNRMFDRRGKLFLLPFQRKAVTNSRQFLNTWRYIHYNPIHHGFTEDVYDWPFSSAQDYRLQKVDPVSLLMARKNSSTQLDFSNPTDFKPDWNDFLEFDY